MSLTRILGFLAGALLLLAVQAEAASFCLTLTRSNGEVTDLFDLEITGSNGSYFSLSLLERSDPAIRRAATGSAVIDGADLLVNITKNTATTINGYRCQLDLASLSGTCSFHFLFLDPADGATGRTTRNAAVTTAPCP